MRARITLALITAAVSAAAAETTWNTPLLGAIFDRESRTIRPVMGVPGAGSLGDAVASPFKIERAFIAPDEAAAVVTGADVTAILSWTGEDARFVPLDNAVRPAGAAWNGRKFALYDGAGTVQIWEGTTLVETRNTEPLPAAFALCDDGRLVRGVCRADATYDIEDSALVRFHNGAREALAEGPFTSLAARGEFVAAAGRELVVCLGTRQTRLTLPSSAVSLNAMRPPGVFLVVLEDGTRWLYADGELQPLAGGDR